MMPVDYSHRRWVMWVRNWRYCQALEPKVFHGKTFYVAACKAAVYFGVDSMAISGESVAPPRARKQRNSNHDPWSWLQTKRKDERRRKSKKRRG